MSHGLKKKTGSSKVSRTPIADSGCCSEQKPWFAFDRLTSNSRYNLDNLRPGRDRETTLLGLYTRLRELSSESRLYWSQQKKSVGTETMHLCDLNFSPGGDAVFGDETIYVLRFDTYQGRGKGRIIGFKSDPCAVFHVIGFDIDFSAYDHG